MLRILSLGAGVQSSTLLLMACEGELQIDAAIFADTGWEPAAVYEWLGVLQEHADVAGIPIHRVSAGNIKVEALSKQGRIAPMPLHTRNDDGRKGILRRQCTQEYKIRPIQRKLRELGATARNPADLVIGISLDEYTRMRTESVRYVRHVYPLVDLRMTRSECSLWLAKRNMVNVVKSACIGCPFRRNESWRDMRDNAPAEFADAVAFDAAVRKHPRLRDRVFLHDQLVPLEMADLRSEQDRGQLDMFETDGCGVLCGQDSA